MDPCPRMLLTFGDSSGNPSRTRAGYEDSAHYVIVTATVDAPEAQRVDARVQELKAKYFGGVNPERVSFHGHQLLRRLSRHAGNRAHAERRFGEAFGDIVDIAEGMAAVTNVVVMDKLSPSENYRTASAVVASWSQSAHMIRRALAGSPPNTIGITVLDRYDGSTSRIVSGIMGRFLGSGAGSGMPAGVKTIPRPIFVDSASSNMVQFVDMFAYIVAKSRMAGDSGMFARLYSRLSPHISHTAHITAE